MIVIAPTSGSSHKECVLLAHKYSECYRLSSEAVTFDFLLTFHTFCSFTMHVLEGNLNLIKNYNKTNSFLLSYSSLNHGYFNI